jgi:hypothetical protein
MGDKMEPTTIIAAVKTGMELFGKLKENDFQSTILRDFRDLKNYMQVINQKVDIIILQNQVILDRLDNLPNEMLRITDSVVSNHLLEERYTNIQGRLTLFTSIDDWADWENNYNGWKDYYFDLNYLFLREYRIGHMPLLIPACELAISVYKGFALPVVKVLLDQKLYRLYSAQEVLRDDIQAKLDTLLSQLANTSYIASHILDENIEDIRKQLYVGHGHRSRTESYTVRECTREIVGDPRNRQTCRNYTLTRQVADTAYNNRYDHHIASIAKSQAALIDSVTRYAEASLVIDLLISYQNAIIRESITENIRANDKTEFVSQTAEEIMEKGLALAPFNILIKRTDSSAA